MSIIKKILKQVTQWMPTVWIVLAVMAGGCAGPRMGFEKFSQDIQSPDPGTRTRAAIYAGNSEDRRTIPLLVDRLEDEDEVVRMTANESLKQITKQDFGYRCYDLPSTRTAAVEKWRNWAAGEGREAVKTK